MIESVSNLKVKEACKLHQKKYRSLTNSFLVEGEHLVEEAIRFGQVIRIFTTEDIRNDSIETWIVTPEVMKKLSQLGESKGIVAVCEKPKNKPLSNQVLLLDRIQDPGNLGTLIRTAAAFGFSTIIAEDSVDYYNEKVVRSTQGTLFQVDLLEGSLSAFIREHHEYLIIGTDVAKGTRLNQALIQESKVAIILGNEGSGVQESLRDLANLNVTIPMKSTESLNVAIAGGILMYEISRRNI